MKSIFNYTKDAADKLNEGLRGPKPGSKKNEKVVDAADIDPNDVRYTQGGKEVSIAKAKAVKPGVYATKNGTGGRWAVEEPTPEDEAEWGSVVNSKNLTKNQRMLGSAFRSGSNIMILGDAGWAKTQLIKKFAKMTGRAILTVYLDKAVATDLGGIPTSVENKDTGRPELHYLMPLWAEEILEHPDKKYLLFFDEMNQAAPDVLNAMMPIVLDHVVCGARMDNIMIAAAGNEFNENGSVNELSVPLAARFRNVLKWETHTKATWDDHFEWAHKKWDSEIGKEAIDKIQELYAYWSSPRDITTRLYNWIKDNIGQSNIFETPEDLLKEYVMPCIWKKVDENTRKTRDFKQKMEDFANWMYNYTKNYGKSAEEIGGRTRGRKNNDANGVNEEEKNAVISALSTGKADFPELGTVFVTLENVITHCFDPSITGVTAEVLEKILVEMDKKGLKVRYQKDADALADAKKYGWGNPADLDQ